jgi:hemolysin activation/secretion protein
LAAWGVCIYQANAAEDIEIVPGRKRIEVKEDAKEQAVKKIETAAQASDKPAATALPEDTSDRFTIERLQISGNSLVSTEELLADIPDVYNISKVSDARAERGDLYDMATIKAVIANPGEPREVSRRTMQGFVQYLLGAYQASGYGGIYIYISTQAVRDGNRFVDNILPIEIVEAKVAEIVVNSYDLNRQRAEKPILRESVIRQWSPVKSGQVIKQDQLDAFVNTLNRNPDRYVSAVISRGSEPDTLALGYDVYEAKPWHYYIQVDDSGSEERQWAPRLGLVNTNLTGIDDRLSLMYQIAPETAADNYSMFASYEVPVFSPGIRLTLYGGTNEFDISGGGGIDFIGNGTFYGSILRLPAVQKDRWGIDIVTSLSHENSEVTPSLFQELATDIDMDLWAIGAELYHSDNSSNSSIAFARVQSVGGSSNADFQKARMNTDSEFNIYTVSAGRTQYLDADRVQQLNSSIRWITSNDRLAPSKLTTFGGLYTVRGYHEDEVVADGGVLFSTQYEFDIVKHGLAATDSENQSDKSGEEKWLKKLALLCFFDLGRAVTKNPVAGEKKIEELSSVGVGTAITLGEHFDAAAYYGYPLRGTADTDAGKGRWNFTLVYRW